MNRRAFNRGVAGVIAATALTRSATLAQAARQVPEPSTFESGDLVWPKIPGVYIPYQVDEVELPLPDMQRWTKERSAFLQGSIGGQSPADAAARSRIANLNFGEFRAQYIRNLGTGALGLRDIHELIGVGHIGIIDIDKGVPHVIEAMPKPGVSRPSYEQWLKGRSGAIVWHGRLANVGKDDRAKIPAAAKKYLGAPFDFWRFNLEDTSGFYCAKLVWLATKQALGIAIDNNPDPSRNFWLSPKQILYSPRVTQLFKPSDDYAFD